MTELYKFDDLLGPDWRKLRQQGRLSAFLPSCETQQWVNQDGGLVGYAALDYRIYPNLAVPGASRHSPDHAGLVERYWSVRTLDSRQDPSWLPSLNLNVVTFCQGKVDSTDCERVLRRALAIRASVIRTVTWLRDPRKADLYVRGLVIGLDVTDGAALLSAIGEIREVQFAVAKVGFSAVDGIMFERVAAPDRFFEIGIHDADELDEVGKRLLADDSLSATDFEWTGINDGPVYDATLGITIKDGRVL